MNDKLFIPKKIKVGYQERDDTYTQMLAYVIYYDSKGKLCKETSWRGWIQSEDVYEQEYVKGKGYVNTTELRQKGLPIHDFDNVPLSGFVLNKKAGGTGNGWDHRQMKCRVYDPRGFEFEIAIDNLLFILQESNSLKGKGLEGEFVYAWSGKDLVLLPTSSEDYVQSQAFTDLKTMKVSTKELVEGYTYLHKNTNKMVYIGKYEYITYADYRKEFGFAKEYMFFDLVENEYKPIKVANLAKIVDPNVISNYADLVEKLQESGLVNPFTVTIKPYTLKLKETYKKSWYDRYGYERVETGSIFMKVGQDTYVNVNDIYAYFSKRDNTSYYHDKQPANPDKKEDTPVHHYDPSMGLKYQIIGNEIKQIKEDRSKIVDDKSYTPDQLSKKEFFKVELNFFNNKKRSL